MFSRDGETELFAMLRAEGVSLEKLIPVPHSWNISDLINGNVDAMSVYLTSEVYTLEKLKASYNLLRPENYGIDFYGDIIFTTEKMTAERPDLVNRFMESTLKGWDYALNHKEEMISLIQDQYGYEGERERLLYEAETIGKLMAESIVEIGHSNRFRWEQIISIYEELGMLEQAVNLDELLYDPDTILTQSRRRSLLLASAILVFALIIGVALFGFNLRLQNEVRKQTGELAQLNSVLGNALKEKDLLLREIHHRVKNNLQIIGSLINLQHSDNQDPIVSAIGRKSLQRIQSMALIHEHLYNSEHLDQVDLGEYLGELIRLVDQGSNSVYQSLVLDIDAEPIMSSIDTAVPLGLLTVELFTNALKHAVNPEKPSPIQVGLHCRDSRCILSIRDRGPGMAPSAFHDNSSDSLGLTLVKTLARQIEAEISITNDGGTEIEVSFPKNSYKRGPDY
jgi:two-component sensor histidine kinase